MCIRKKTNCLHKIKETNFFKFSIGISSYFSNLIQDLLTDLLFCAIITKAYLICFKNEKNDEMCKFILSRHTSV